MHWPGDGSNPGEDHRDFNMWWKPDLVVDFLKLTGKMMDKNGLDGIGLTPGETQNWYRFDEWGYARRIFNDKEALANLSLITSHSFARFHEKESTYYGDWRSVGTDLLRSKKPSLHAWVTSHSWGKMDANFIDDIRRNIYISKVNGFIPWAVVQRANQWIGGDPNPGTAIKVNDEGNYQVMPGYYYFKQVSRAGEPGMAVVAVTSLDPDVSLIAWAGNKTKNADAFVVINIEDEKKDC